MVVEELGVYAHPTIVAMFEIRFASNATEATVRTVIGFFSRGHPKVAYGTVIFSELDFTFNTVVSTFEEEKVSNELKNVW